MELQLLNKENVDCGPILIPIPIPRFLAAISNISFDCWSLSSSHLAADKHWNKKSPNEGLSAASLDPCNNTLGNYALNQHQHSKTSYIKTQGTTRGFSSNRPTGPIRSSSRDVRLMFDVCLMFDVPFSHICTYVYVCPHFPKSDVQNF